MRTILKITILPTLFSLLQFNTLKAQTTGSIRGTITDENGKYMIGAAVQLFSDSTYIKGAVSDTNGIYTVRNLHPGSYDIHISMFGYQKYVEKNVSLSAGQTLKINKQMVVQTQDIPAVVIKPHKKPIIAEGFGNPIYIDRDQIKLNAVPATNPATMIASYTSDVIPTDDGRDLYIRGSRRGTTQYIVDGNKMTGSEIDIPSMAINNMVVVTGGIPAEFGDLTGGVVIITTKDHLSAYHDKMMRYNAYYEELDKQKRIEEQKADENNNETKEEDNTYNE